MDEIPSIWSTAWQKVESVVQAEMGRGSQRSWETGSSWAEIAVPLLDLREYFLSVSTAFSPFVRSFPAWMAEAGHPISADWCRGTRALEARKYTGGLWTTLGPPDLVPDQLRRPSVYCNLYTSLLDPNHALLFLCVRPPLRISMVFRGWQMLSWEEGWVYRRSDPSTWRPLTRIPLRG